MLKKIYLFIRKNMPEKIQIKLIGLLKMKTWINLNDPQTYVDKINWLKLYYRNPLMTQCADKYLVRNYVKDKGLGHLLNEIYDVYHLNEPIDFSNIPRPSVLKINYGSGYNYFLTDETDINSLEKELINRLKSNDYHKISKEWAYKNIEPVIISEKYLPISKYEQIMPVEYKVMCFNGEPEFVMISGNVHLGSKDEKPLRAIYDVNKKRMSHVVFDRNNWENCQIVDDATYQKLLTYSKILSEDFPVVRVDFYVLETKIIFGELTFYSGGGYNIIKPYEFNKYLGSKININSIKKSKFYKGSNDSNEE